MSVRTMTRTGPDTELDSTPPETPRCSGLGGFLLQRTPCLALENRWGLLTLAQEL
jgi:hypothetical protein